MVLTLASADGSMRGPGCFVNELGEFAAKIGLPVFAIVLIDPSMNFKVSTIGLTHSG